MKNIGVLGFGNMGSAIAEKLKNDYKIFVFDKDQTKTNAAQGLKAVNSIAELFNDTDILILAVKPQDSEAILNEIKPKVKDKLVISIAAGITTGFIEKILGVARVIRVMPNLPAKIAEGMSCLTQGKFASQADLDFTEDLFDYLGETLIIDESMMNAATAISGSGPGFFYDFIEGKKLDDNIKKDFENQLINAAQAISFDEEQAHILAHTTVNGSIALLKLTGLTPLELKKQVTSKGGTTEAGLEILHKGGFLEEAVKAALKRAQELCKE